MVSPQFVSSRLVSVPAPTNPVYRLTKLGVDPFAPPPRQFIGDNRFDDPRRQFQVIYCASERAGAFGETLARYQRSMSLLALLRDVEDDEESLEDALEGLLDPADTGKGVVPADWRFKRQIGVTLLNPSLLFADIAAAESVHHLRAALAPTALKLGFDDFDLSTVLSSDRAMTQQCARYLYEQQGNGGRPMFAGIRYPSRHNLNWTCWAIFGDRINHVPQMHETTIDSHDPAFLEAARLMGLSIEAVRGHGRYITP